MYSYKRKKKSFAKEVTKGVAKGLGKLAKGAAVGIASEFAATLSLGLYKPPRR